MLVALLIHYLSFWTARDAPDSLQKMYDGVSEYLEMTDRTELLNARYGFGTAT